MNPATDSPAGYALARPQIEKVRYSHDAMIDVIIAKPQVSQKELATLFGYTQPWVSTVIASDAFQARLALRKEELVDPTIIMSTEERFRALTDRSLAILQEKLCQPALMVPDALALKAAELGAKVGSLGGFGAATIQPIQTEVQADRLERLADRLTGLIHNRRGEVQDVQVIENGRGQQTDAGEEDRPGGSVQGSQPDGSQPDQGTV